MPPKMRAATILHEVIYRLAITKFNHQNSIYVRYVISMILSRKLNEMNDRELFHFYANAHFLQAEIRGVNIHIRNVDGDVCFAQFHHDQSLAWAYAAKHELGPSRILVDNHYVDVKTPFQPIDQSRCPLENKFFQSFSFPSLE
jgi:hypothetical protein